MKLVRPVRTRMVAAERIKATLANIKPIKPMPKLLPLPNPPSFTGMPTADTPTRPERPVFQQPKRPRRQDGNQRENISR